jgi:formylglycine-generating enzyme required for sulfatase activity
MTRSLFLILVLGSDVLVAQTHFTKDCFLPDIKEQNKVHNCYSGVEFQLIESQGPSVISSFYISSFLISRQEYFHFLKTRSLQATQALKALNPMGEYDYIRGLTWDEARKFCQAYGQSLPTESELEVAKMKNSQSELEWTGDYFGPRAKTQRLNPSHLRTVRSSRNGGRWGRSASLRNPRLGFRCASAPSSSNPQNILLDHSKRLPAAGNSGLHYLRLETRPSGANIYLGTQNQHKLGNSPFFGTLSHRNTVLILKRRGYHPQTLRLKTPLGKAQRVEIHLNKLPDNSWTEPRRQVSMLLIPGGRQKMGLDPLKTSKIQGQILARVPNQDLSPETVRQYLKPETSDRMVFVKDFYMDRFEVTNAQYLSYAKQTDLPKSRCWHIKRLARPKQPVACLNWMEARGFCQFFGLELPTETQFERASQGTDPMRRVAWLKTPRNGGQEKRDVSRYGINDLAGNVSEWTLDWFDPDAYSKYAYFNPRPTSLIRKEKVIRGGSFAPHRLDHRLSKRRHKQPLHFAMDLGFRCVKNNLGVLHD